MFVTDRVLDIIVKAKEDAHALSARVTDSAHALAVAAISNEVAGLRRAVEKLEEQLKYERARADGLVDRLLVRDARVAAVAPSAVAAAVYKDEKAVEKLKEIFDEMNSAGVDFPAKDQRAFNIAGGTAVDAGHSGGL